MAVIVLETKTLMDFFSDGAMNFTETKKYCVTNRLNEKKEK